MPTRCAIKNVNVQAISLVTKGANGKRICLLKQAGEVTDEQLPAHTNVIKSWDDSESWSTFYCVVAEPDAVENGGVLAPDVEDVWTVEEIRKAAHQFMANGGLVNKAHEDVLLGEDFQPYGQLVENAIALNDVVIPQPDGSDEVIKEGSWYVAIAPTEEGKQMIEAGEFTGVSIQGECEREVIAKERKPSLAERLFGKKEQPEPRPVAKVDDFATRRARSEFSGELWDAVSTLENTLWDAIYQYGEDEQVDPVPVIERSIEQFKDWAVAQATNLSPADAVAKAQEAEWKGRFTVPLPPVPTIPGEEATPATTQEDDSVTAEERIAKLEKDTQDGFAALTAAVAKVADTVTERLPEPEPKAPTPQELQEQLTTIGSSLETLAKSVERLGDGDSKQDDEGNTTPVAKGFNPERPLAGLLD